MKACVRVTGAREAGAREARVGVSGARGADSSSRPPHLSWQPRTGGRHSRKTCDSPERRRRRSVRRRRRRRRRKMTTRMRRRPLNNVKSMKEPTKATFIKVMELLQ